MSPQLELAHCATFPVTPERAYDAVLTAPLEQIFRRRYWAIPPIVGVRDQVGTWGTPGQTRTIVMADKGTLREELTLAQRPHAFGYDISGVTGPMKPLVSSAQGRWSFDADGGGTRVTWAWTVQPRSALANLAMPIFARLWRGNARQGFEELGNLLRKD
ncbi:MAG: SRPBCC family protein [Marmoricola sp.]